MNVNASAIPPGNVPQKFSAESRLEEIGPMIEAIIAACADILGDAVAEEVQEKLDTLQLCLAEAMNNVVEHAYRNEPGHPVDAYLDLGPDRICVTITDSGAAMPGGKPPETWDGFDPQDLENLPEGGFGWMLIHSEMDEVVYSREDAQNILRLSIAL